MGECKKPIQYIIFFYFNMSLLYKYRQERDLLSTGQSLDEDTMDIASISRFLRRVGLKIPDVKMKLGINKIIRHFEKLSIQSGQHSSLINQLRSDKIDSYQITHFDRQPSGKENEPSYCQPNNFANIELSKSLTESHSYLEHFDHKKTDLLIKESTLSKAFNVKEVVTKNALEEAQVNYHGRVRFASSVPSVSESDDNFQIIEQLQLQNQILQKCLKNIFSFFEEKKLFYSQGLNKHQYLSGVDQLTVNFINYQREVQEKMSVLETKSQKLQENLHNLSISLRIEKQALDEERNRNSKLVQTDQTQSVEADCLKKELRETSSTLREKQVILFIKEEEIAALKVIISDLENKVRSGGEGKARQRNYKKFFEATGQNLSKTE